MALLITAVANLMGGTRASTRYVNVIIRHGGGGGGSGGTQQHGNHRSLLISNSVAFSSSFSTFSTKHRHQSISITTLQYSSPYVNSKCCGYHSTITSLLAATARKRNGGKRKKKPVQGGSSNTHDNVLDEEENHDGDTNEEQTLITHNEDDINTILNHKNAKDEVSEFAPIFASDYHAPVMVTECVNALLQRGEWHQMLLERKERRRKRMRILEAKRKRAEVYDDDVDDDDDDDEDDANEDVDTDVAQRLSSSPSSSEVFISNDSNFMHPRIFIDGTLGGGGHSQALLQELSDGDILIGCDVDPEALSTASKRLIDYLATCDYILDKNNKPSCGWVEGRPMFIPVQSNFRNLATVLSKVRHPITEKKLLGNRITIATDNNNNNNNDTTEEVEFPRGVNGMLLDLGVSSHQIDVAERGFAFMKDGPLDMRMSGNSQSCILTAADICNEFDEASLIDILRTFGDEPRARRIVSAIMASRPLTTTTDLVHAINTVTPTFARQKRAGLIATSARVFQALRIVVNEEDAALKEVLENVSPWALARSVEGEGVGILAVLSYHSMEDKMAKRVIRDGKVDFFEKGSIKLRGGGSPERDLYGNIIDDRIKGSNDLPFEPLTRPKKATDEEVAGNSRSRSATLRVAIRI